MRWMVLLAALGGCTTARTLMGPDGTPHVYVRCSNNMGRCYDKAAEICPSGYAIADRTQQTDVDSDKRGEVSSSSKFSMLIKCKGS